LLLCLRKVGAKNIAADKKSLFMLVSVRVWLVQPKMMEKCRASKEGPTVLRTRGIGKQQRYDQ